MHYAWLFLFMRVEKFIQSIKLTIDECVSIFVFSFYKK